MIEFTSKIDNFIINLPKMPKVVEFGDSKKTRIYQLNRLYTSYNVTTRELYDNDMPKTENQLLEKLVSELKTRQMAQDITKQDHWESKIQGSQCLCVIYQVTSKTQRKSNVYEAIFIKSNKIYVISLIFNAIRVRQAALFGKFISSFRFIKD